MSPKNKGRNKAPITDPDEFIAGVQTTAERLKPYAGHIVLGAAVLLVVSLVIVIYSWIGDRRAEAATDAFAEVVAITGEFAGMPMPTPEGGMVQPTYETSAEQAEAALERLEHLRAEHGSAVITKRARLLEGSLLLRLDRFDEAREAYQSVVDSDAPELWRVQAREGIAYAHEGEALAVDDDPDARQDGLERALDSFAAMQPDEEGLRRATALYHQGRILDELGRRDEAVEKLEQAITRGGPGVTAEAQQRLAALGEAPASPEDGGPTPGADIPSDPAAPPPSGGAREPVEP